MTTPFANLDHAKEFWTITDFMCKLNHFSLKMF